MAAKDEERKLRKLFWFVLITSLTLNVVLLIGWMLTNNELSKKADEIIKAGDILLRAIEDANK